MEYMTIREAENQNDMIQPFQSLDVDKETLAKIIEFFPYPIQVYLPDGTIVLANEASLKIMHIHSKAQLIGKFNVLKDPVIDMWGEGIREQISKSFRGETVQFQDLRIPIQGIMSRFDSNELCFDSSFQNITCFPIYDNQDQLAYVVHVFVTSKIYSGKDEMVKAKQYIERHWLEEYDLDMVARSVNLSRYHFSRLFKRYTSMTPHEYYQEVKINKLKEKIRDGNISISQAFAACGMEYSGNYARLFKEKVGMTPSQYRKTNRL